MRDFLNNLSKSLTRTAHTLDLLLDHLPLELYIEAPTAEIKF